MHSSVIITVFCVIFANFCQSAPLDNEIPQTSEVTKYLFVAHKYKKFLQSPPPIDIIIRTRSFITENVKRVDPIGVVLRRCNETVGFDFDKRYCYPSNKTTVQLKVKIWNPNPKIVIITADEHTECTCAK